MYPVKCINPRDTGISFVGRDVLLIRSIILPDIRVLYEQCYYTYNYRKDNESLVLFQFGAVSFVHNDK